MKIILLVDVPNLAKKNEIVEVNDGYAKNFLIKNKMAVAYSESSLKKLNETLKDEQDKHELELYQAQLLKSKLESLELTFYLRANHGNAFGKITVKQLIDEINKNEKIVNKYMFIEKEWGLGPHSIHLKLHDDVIATIKINVLEQN